ncbi:iron-sulfur cluster co-chaperone protein hscb [Holotrichia oblita]|uniref:Iron-sulfur cluster co-chaperone protein hscb n=1 Tax=Holotrichia oblita TaxID=644536 RepID=A0ACB9SIE9_HOLOL|nr:iron-sulfur cluster co-chaperone protein hscb [Holotrichia oblita]
MHSKHTLDRFLNYINRCNYSRQTSTYNNGLHNLKSASLQFFRSTQNTSLLKCWKCGIERKNVSDLFCESCHSIQNPHEKGNYFKVFNLDVTYDVNQKALTNSYRKMQSVLHPDKFSNKSDIEKEISAEYSSLVNKAYNTLQTPIKRAIHLLSLNNETISEDNKSDNPEFLMEMMEVNEEIDEADSPEKLKSLRERNNRMLNKCSEEVSQHFKDNNIEKAKEAIIKMKYYGTIMRRINDLMREKGIVD